MLRHLRSTLTLAAGAADLRLGAATVVLPPKLEATLLDSISETLYFPHVHRPLQILYPSLLRVW